MIAESQALTRSLRHSVPPENSESRRRRRSGGETRLGGALGLWRAAVGPEGWWSVAGPTLFVFAGLALLVYNHVHRQVTEVAFWIGIATIATVFVWTIQGNRRRTRTIARYRADALRDRLTGLPNRACLESDLAGAMRFAREPLSLAVVQLGSSGARAGRAATPVPAVALRAFAAQLSAAVGREGGTAYRIGDFSLALVTPASAPVPALISGAASAAERAGGACEVAHGLVGLPDEAPDAELALELALERVATYEAQQPRSAKRQAHSALLAVLAARRPELREHLRAVVPQAVAVGRRLGLGRDELDDLVLAAGLQDIGMLSIPEAIIAKGSRLAPAERDILERHPIAGERIVAAAPNLGSVAALVRSSYERYDGSGYPDRLAGERIPMGARVIAVCVAFAAITSPRPYSPAASTADAVAELRRCAGT